MQIDDRSEGRRHDGRMNPILVEDGHLGHQQRRPYWEYAAQLLMDAAQDGKREAIEEAYWQPMRALKADRMMVYALEGRPAPIAVSPFAPSRAVRRQMLA